MVQSSSILSTPQVQHMMEYSNIQDQQCLDKTSSIMTLNLHDYYKDYLSINSAEQISVGITNMTQDQSISLMSRTDEDTLNDLQNRSATNGLIFPLSFNHKRILPSYFEVGMLQSDKKHNLTNNISNNNSNNNDINSVENYTEKVDQLDSAVLSNTSVLSQANTFSNTSDTFSRDVATGFSSEHDLNRFGARATHDDKNKCNLYDADFHTPYFCAPENWTSYEVSDKAQCQAQYLYDYSSNSLQGATQNFTDTLYYKNSAEHLPMTIPCSEINKDVSADFSTLPNPDSYCVKYTLPTSAMLNDEEARLSLSDMMKHRNHIVNLDAEDNHIEIIESKKSEENVNDINPNNSALHLFNTNQIYLDSENQPVYIENANKSDLVYEVADNVINTISPIAQTCSGANTQTASFIPNYHNCIPSSHQLMEEENKEPNTRQRSFSSGVEHELTLNSMTPSESLSYFGEYNISMERLQGDTSLSDLVHDASLESTDPIIMNKTQLYHVNEPENQVSVKSKLYQFQSTHSLYAEQNGQKDIVPLSAEQILREHCMHNKSMSDNAYCVTSKRSRKRKLIRPSQILCYQLTQIMPVLLRQFETSSASRKGLCRQLVGQLYPNSPKPSPNFLLNTLLPVFRAADVLGFSWSTNLTASLSYLRLWVCNQRGGRELIQQFRVEYNAPTGKDYQSRITKMTYC